jgi:alpha-tubulin suppressor-like RCC1 family protein
MGYSSVCVDTDSEHRGGDRVWRLLARRRRRFRDASTARVQRCVVVAVAAAVSVAVACVPAQAQVPNVALTWGLNLHGQLGDNFGEASETHTEGPESCLFGGTGSEEDVGCSTAPVQVSSLSGVTRVAAGEEDGLALLENGTVWAWGDNESDQLGDGISGREQEESDVPVQVQSLEGGVSAIAAGTEHSLALAGGTVWAWGSNERDQLGDNVPAELERDTPVAVSGLSEVVAIAAGGFHSLALLAGGTVTAWGDNGLGQLGNGTSKSSDKPVTVKQLSGAVAVAAGEQFSLALLSDGKVKAWGDDESGQLGDGKETTRKRLPADVKKLTGVTAIAAGAEHSLALLSNGTVMAWGNDEFGQLGDGTTTDSTVPVAVTGLSHVVAIAAGGDHSLALLEDGAVMAWGENEYGQLGNGSSTSPLCGAEGEQSVCSATPVEVKDLGAVTGIAAGFQYSLAY